MRRTQAAPSAAAARERAAPLASQPIDNGSMNGTEGTAELEEAVQRHLESLTPEQREAVRVYATDYVARRTRVVVDGKVRFQHGHAQRMTAGAVVVFT